MSLATPDSTPVVNKNQQVVPRKDWTRYNVAKRVLIETGLPDRANRRDESERWDWGLFNDLRWTNGEDKPFWNPTQEEIRAYYGWDEDETSPLGQ